MASENTALSVLNGYSLDTILPCVADHEKIRGYRENSSPPYRAGVLYPRSEEINKQIHVARKSL
jgi:hypothetical protein